MKKSASFYHIFASSPIKPIQEHMAKIFQCVDLLRAFFEYSVNADWASALTCHQKILALENAGDDLKKEIRLHLPNNLFMPVNRTDLLELLTVQDKIASKAKYIASLILTRKMQLPPNMVDDYRVFLARSIDVVRRASDAIHELDALVDTGFKGPEVALVTKMIQDLDDNERESDQLEFKLRGVLFHIENQLNPIEVVFLYKLIDWTGELADKAQHVGYRLEVLLAQ